LNVFQPEKLRELVSLQGGILKLKEEQWRTEFYRIAYPMLPRMPLLEVNSLSEENLHIKEKNLIGEQGGPEESPRKKKMKVMIQRNREVELTCM